MNYWMGYWCLILVICFWKNHQMIYSLCKTYSMLFFRLKFLLGLIYLCIIKEHRERKAKWMKVLWIILWIRPMSVCSWNFISGTPVSTGLGFGSLEIQVMTCIIFIFIIYYYFKKKTFEAISDRFHSLTSNGFQHWNSLEVTPKVYQAYRIYSCLSKASANSNCPDWRPWLEHRTKFNSAATFWVIEAN